MTKTLLGLVYLISMGAANADILKLNPSDTKLKGVTLATSAEAAGFVMPNEASGLRVKYVLIKGVPVYVLQIFALDPSSIVKTPNGTEMLDTLSVQRALAVRMDFVYDVSADQVYTGFVDSFSANHVDLNKPHISSFLNAVKNGGAAPVGSSMSFLLTKSENGNDTMTFENPEGGVTTIEGPGFAHEFFSMWLGLISPNDRGLKELRATLTTP